MATNKLMIRPRLTIYPRVDPDLYAFVQDATPEELNAVLLHGLRLWHEITYPRLVNRHHQSTGSADHIQVVAEAKIREEPQSTPAGFATLDIEDLGLGGVFVQTAPGG